MSKKMINSTNAVPSGETEGLGQTLEAYEKGWDMNKLNDVTGAHSEWDGSGIGKGLKGSGSKP